MPHFVIDCAADILNIQSPEDIMRAVYKVAEDTGLFADGDIKVRVNPFQYFMLGPGKKKFIHIFGNIMEGRTVAQKADLSKKIIQRLKAMFPDVPVISINIREFERSTYCNRSMV